MNSEVVEPLDLTSCDREPINTPGTIQPHGAMLVVDSDTFEILQAAGDTTALLGASAHALLGRKLETLFRPRQVRRLRILKDRYVLGKPRHLLDLALKDEKSITLDASIHRSDGFLVLEFENADLTDSHFVNPLVCGQYLIEGLDMARSQRTLCQLAAERVRSVSGFDRVVVYRFLDDNSAWVFVESREEWLDPFLDLVYPAAHIPGQARALYLNSRVQLLAHVDYEPAPLIPLLNPRTQQPLDMRQAILRDVPVVHREYLRSMDVDSSMSSSIVSEGKVWGLIACHHYSPRRLPRYLRSVFELFGSFFSLQLEARLRADLSETRLASRTMLQRLMRSLADEPDYAQGLVRELPALLDYMTSRRPTSGSEMGRGLQCGIAVRVNNQISVLGSTPCTEDIEALTEWLAVQTKDSDGVFMTDRLGELWKPAKSFAAVGAGLLVATVSRESREFVLWFRPEYVQTLSCGPDPRKAGDRLKPVNSHEAWRTPVRGRSRPWFTSDREAGVDLHVSILEVILRRIDDIAREQSRAQAQESTLMAELDHRAEDTLANVQALAVQSNRITQLVSGFTEALDHRIHAMDKANNLLAESRWQGVSIDNLVHAELDVYSRGGGDVVISGADVVLTPQAALAMSLAVHELAANAAKYGPLSRSGGGVKVVWRMTEVGGVELSWQETGASLGAPPQKRGFGVNLIEQALAMETGAQSTLNFDEGGTTCSVVMPASSIFRPLSERTDNTSV